MADRQLTRAESLTERNAAEAAALKHLPGDDETSGVKRLAFVDGWMARAQVASRDLRDITRLSNEVDRLTNKLNEMQAELFRANAAAFLAKGKPKGT